MLNRYKKQVMLAGVGLTAITLGAATSALTLSGTLARVPLVGQWLQPVGMAPPAAGPESDTQSKVLSLVGLPPSERADALGAIARSAPSLDRNRARFLLACDRIDQGNGGAAIALLDGLERDYPLLAAHILARRAQAYAATGDQAKAQATWAALESTYPKDPAVVEALFNRGKTDPGEWDQAIAQFPAHPRTLAMVQARLQKNPKQPQLLLVLARYGSHLEGIVGILDRLKTDYGPQLKPDDWEAIAFAYWENQEYSKASEAYAKAPHSPLNFYRVGRGAQLGDRVEDAIAAYQRLLQAYPDTPEAGLALVRLGKIIKPAATAITFLDRASQRAETAPEALMAKADILEQRLNQPAAALTVRQGLLKQYSHSDEAAELRWQQVEQHRKKRDLPGAWQWAQQLVKENPQSDYAPQASFWIGKWAQQMGQAQQAQQAFEYVLSNYPESYYAWRSAVFLGWDVGDFSTVRAKQPTIVKPLGRSRPPAGSAALQELYLLGQNYGAWALWQVEFTNRVKPTMAEQFTDGLMRLGVNDNLDGIFMISNLAQRRSPQEQADYTALKRQPAHWQALYPFPYEAAIAQWAQQRQLNPMLVTALIRQESRFEPKIRSVSDAVGLMQLIPDTAQFVADQVKLKPYNLENPNDNINLGTWYLDYTHREYANNSLFAVASYNAGPNAVADWIQRFGVGDPDQFVEQIPFEETKGYVKAVLGNYWNYLRLYNPDISQQLARYSAEHQAIGKPSPPGQSRE